MLAFKSCFVFAFVFGENWFLYVATIWFLYSLNTHAVFDGSTIDGLFKVQSKSNWVIIVDRMDMCGRIKLDLPLCWARNSTYLYISEPRMLMSAMTSSTPHTYRIIALCAHMHTHAIAQWFVHIFLTNALQWEGIHPPNCSRLASVYAGHHAWWRRDDDVD